MTRIDPLRERVARPELAEARTLLERGGIAALVAWARERLSASLSAEARLAKLDDVEAYLRETVREPRRLRGDLRAWRKGTLDRAALAERVAHVRNEAERAAEVGLALARAALADGHAPLHDLGALFELCRIGGRFGRRVEALGLLADLGRHGLGPAETEAIAVVARALTTRTEHRWVQPAALAALAAVDPRSAIERARDRLSHPEGGDDFLVRERILDLAARALLGPGAWDHLVHLASIDPSEHVRITLARGERDPSRLARLLRDDASPRVRATAAITLASHEPARAEAELPPTLARDPHFLPVRTVAEELTSLSRRGAIVDAEAVAASLSRAAERAELPAHVRRKVAEAAAEVALLGDPLERAAWERLAPLVAETPLGGHVLVSDAFLEGLDDARLGRVLAVLATRDFPLGLDRVESGLLLHRGEPRRLRPWRLLHELGHPGPGKRQAFDHTLGNVPVGALRAPPGGLAELTATAVPGERVLSERAGDWGRSLPRVDDLLSTGVLRPRAVALHHPEGSIRLAPARTLPRRLRAWFVLTTRYAELSEARRRALESEEPNARARFLAQVAEQTGIVVDHVAPSPREESAFGLPAPRASSIALSLGPLGIGFEELSRYATSPHGNRLPHLAAYATVMLGVFLLRGVAIRRSIEHDRAAIPLVIGGWGTRGKSGVERLKAALFQGLGHECLVKTTGCEAMFIHAVPGLPAREIFLHRPYDKATVWEQRDVLALARSLGVRVFLWECMALQPDLVNLLQSQWMRDDYSTITNAYPDHEDVQGPSGWDVASVISEFVPTQGHLVTAEEQMLPLLAERARERGTVLRRVEARDAELVSDEILARFPYAEHPRNVALVARLARTLGVPSTIALAEMADHVVPDLGVLKDYGAVAHLGRTLSFVNGMSANERTAALGNYRRTGFADPVEPGTWTIMLVNNRADRVARSEVFARFLVEDVSAHRHVLIGTNVEGLRTFIDAALDRHLAAVSPTFELSGDGTERLRTARARLDKALERLKVGGLGASDAARELAGFSAPGRLDEATLERLLTPESPEESFEEARAALSSLDPFVTEVLAKKRAARALHALLSRDLGHDAQAIDRAFGRAYRAMLHASLVVIGDPRTSGDGVLDRIARAVPEGVHARILGLQNIKGTGLDFVYRWVSIDFVRRQLSRLDGSTETRAEALAALLTHSDFGLLDARMALEALEGRREDDLEPLVARLRTIVAARERALSGTGEQTLGDRLRAFTGMTFDYLDSTRRRRMATAVLEALVERRLSHGSAATAMRAIVARAKGAWLRRSP